MAKKPWIASGWKDENGERQIVRASDRMLYDRHLDEGSLVTFDEKHQLTAWFAK